MKRKFKPGDLVVNTGRLRGMGYVWRVEGYAPRWEGNEKQYSTTVFNLLCKNIGLLRGKADPLDHAIGAVYEYDQDTKELLGGMKPAEQMQLL